MKQKIYNLWQPLKPMKEEDITHIAIFNGKKIRRKLIGDKWFFSVVDIVGILTDSNKLFSLLKKKKKLSYYTTIKKTKTKLLDKKWKLRLI